MPVCIGGNSPVRRKVLATTRSLPQESILEEHRRRTHPRVNHAEPAVEHAALEHVITPKAEGRPERDVAKGRPPALCREVGSAHPTVGNELVQVMSQALVGRMVQLVGQLPLLAFGDLEAGMRGLAAEPPAAAKQPHDPVPPPMTASQHLAVKKIAPLHTIRLMPRR